MATKRLLLIKPRWLPEETVLTHLQTLRAERPHALFTLLADAALPQEECDFIPLPNLYSGKLMLVRSVIGTLRRVRRRRYDEAILLAEAYRGEAGYLEAKLWTFAARSSRRRFGFVRPLELRHEFADKARRLVPFLSGRALTALNTSSRLPSELAARSRRKFASLHLQRRHSEMLITRCPICRTDLPRDVARELGARHRRCPTCHCVYEVYLSVQQSVGGHEYQPRSVQRRKQRLQTFVYLRHLEQLCGMVKGKCLFVGQDSALDPELARQQGWQVHEGEENCLASDFSSQFQFVALLDVMERQSDPSVALARVQTLLAPRGVCLTRTYDAAVVSDSYNLLEEPGCRCFLSKEAVAILAQRLGFRILEENESLFSPSSLDIWLVNEDSH